jgi:hypothetical protein
MDAMQDSDTIETQEMAGCSRRGQGAFRGTERANFIVSPH